MLLKLTCKTTSFQKYWMEVSKASASVASTNLIIVTRKTRCCVFSEELKRTLFTITGQNFYLHCFWRHIIVAYEAAVEASVTLRLFPITSYAAEPFDHHTLELVRFPAE